MGTFLLISFRNKPLCKTLSNALLAFRNGLQVWRKVMAAYRRVYDSRHLQADCKETGSAPEPYDR